MQIPCVSCQSIFRLDSNLVSPAGSLVRCSKCKYIFMVYPPTTNNEPIVRDSTIDQSVLFDLFEVDQTHRAKLAHHRDPAVINILETGEITSIDDFEQEEGDQEPEDTTFDYADLPDLSEHEKTIDGEDS